jgi:uncharacterized protein YjeT (DUF2065 family)
MNKVINLVVSIVLALSGLTMVYYGQDAYSAATDALVAENIVTAEDAEIPGVVVDDIKTAVAQADVIQHHVLERNGGKTYAEMDRDDPNRESYTKAVVLRTALFSGAQAIGLSLLAIGNGLLWLLLGAAGIVKDVLDRRTA